MEPVAINELKVKRISLGVKNKLKRRKTEMFSEIDFTVVNQTASAFAAHIQNNFEELAEILLDYESFEVVEDEVRRTLDILNNLNENREYFVLRVGAIASFLPRNQPLYALTCFVLVPSLMASEVHFRIPHSMRHFFPRLLRTLKISQYFPNVVVSAHERFKFLRERSALLVDPKTEESRPITDAVIFTGTPYHAEKLRLIFDKRTLFIANGAGHNPIVVSEDASVPKAVDAVLTLQLYNQGQDCAAPNAVLVHEDVYAPFMRHLRDELKKVRVGDYHDRSCRVGPISEPEDLKRIQSLLVDNYTWIDPMTPGVIRTNEALVEPTIISKPLKEGGNYSEVFSPVIFIHQYDKDAALSSYFDNPLYVRNAMYISLYGTSNYVESLINKTFEGKIIHDKTTILHDQHLHMPGVERGTKPYGGYGYAASSLSINGTVIPKPTLPQRDIFEHLVKPILSPGVLNKKKIAALKEKKLVFKDVRKILGLKVSETSETKKKAYSPKSYIDGLEVVASDSQRYIEFIPEKTFHLLAEPNIAHIAIMEPKQTSHIRALRKYLKVQKRINKDDFEHFLYGIAKKPHATKKENKESQLAFFQNIYQLLLGKDFGPRLTYFLVDADRQQILSLLDV